MSDNDFFINMRDQLKTDHISLRTVIDLLIEKGIFTEDEYKQHFDSVKQEQGNILLKYLATGKLENK